MDFTMMALKKEELEHDGRINNFEKMYELTVVDLKLAQKQLEKLDLEKTPLEDHQILGIEMNERFQFLED
jgi:hypothetical protein